MKITITAALSHLPALFFALVIAFIAPTQVQAADEGPIIGEDLTLEDIAYSDAEIQEFKAKISADKELLRQAYNQVKERTKRESDNYDFDLVFEQALQMQPPALSKIERLYTERLVGAILNQQHSQTSDIRLIAFLRYNKVDPSDPTSMLSIGDCLGLVPSKSTKDTKRMYYWLARTSDMINAQDNGQFKIDVYISSIADFSLGRSYLVDLLDYPNNRRLKALARQHLTQYIERFQSPVYAERTSHLSDATLALSDYYAFFDNDEVQAAKWAKVSAEHGNSIAAGKLALMYLQGKGITTNYKQSFTWAQKAAEDGDSFGTFILGVLYEEGLGTKINSRKALSNYSKACDLGEAQACQAHNKLYSILNHKTLEEQAELYLTK